MLRPRVSCQEVGRGRSVSELWLGCVLGEVFGTGQWPGGAPGQGSVHVRVVPRTASSSAFTGHVVSVRCCFLFLFFTSV